MSRPSGENPAIRPSRLKPSNRAQRCPAWKSTSTQHSTRRIPQASSISRARRVAARIGVAGDRKAQADARPSHCMKRPPHASTAPDEARSDQDGPPAAIARAYVEEGARTVLADVAKDEGQALAAELEASHPGMAVFAHHDVSDEGAWATLVEETNERFGPVTVLANTPASCASARSVAWTSRTWS